MTYIAKPKLHHPALQKNKVGEVAGKVQYDWTANWMTPALTALAIFVVFLLIVFFRPQGFFGRSAERT